VLNHLAATAFGTERSCGVNIQRRSSRPPFWISPFIDKEVREGAYAAGIAGCPWRHSGQSKNARAWPRHDDHPPVERLCAAMAARERTFFDDDFLRIGAHEQLEDERSAGDSSSTAYNPTDAFVSTYNV
jgi:hypothetical protein